MGDAYTFRMHEIHPSPHAATGWRDFFVHIGTIVLGLLIAVGIEQAVEHVHHRHQVEQLSEAVAAENQVALADDATNIRLIDARVAAVKTNMSRLNAARKQPGMPVEFVEAAGSSVFFAPPDSAWLGMRDSGLLPLLSELHSGNYWKTDYRKQRVVAAIVEVDRVSDRLAALERLQTPDTPPTAAEIQELRVAFSEDLEQLLHLRAACIAADADIELDASGQGITPATVGEAKKRREDEVK